MAGGPRSAQATPNELISLTFAALAAADLKETFSKHADATRLFDVECVSVDKGAPVIEVCPTQRKGKKGKKQ